MDNGIVDTTDPRNGTRALDKSNETRDVQPYQLLASGHESVVGRVDQQRVAWSADGSGD
jgi:hypothetical protein